MHEKTKKTSLRQSLILMTGSLIFTLCVLEGVLHFLAARVPQAPEGPKSDWALVPERVWTEHHLVLGWYHQPLKNAVHDVNGRAVPVHINSAGFRGEREYAFEKPGGTRLAFLGDSFVFGFGVEETSILTRLLEDRHPDLEVLNLGVPGYGMDQILLSYRSIARKYHPDAVLIGVFPEQFWRSTRAFADSGHAKPYFSLGPDGALIRHNDPVPPPYALKTHQFPELVETGPVDRFLSHSYLYRLVKKNIFLLGRNLGWIDPDLTVEWQVGKAILATLLEEIRRDGARPVLVIMPPKRWAESDSSTSLLKSLRRFAERQKVDLLDLTPVFRKLVHENAATDYYIQNDWHWTAKGHAVAADQIEIFLKSKGMLAS